MKNFNIFGVHRKIRFLGGGGIHEKPISMGDCLKRGTWTVCRFKGGGLGKKEGRMFLKGVDTPMQTMDY